MDRTTYRVHTLGCRVNLADSLAIERELSRAGFKRAAPGEVPGLWVVNTCAVTAEGLKKSRKMVRRCARSGASVVVTGCGVDFEAECFEVPGVTATVSNSNKKDIVTAAAQDCLPAGWKAGPVTWEPEKLTRIPVKIQDGCDRYCTYCIVPFLRAPKSSRLLTSVLEEIRMLNGLEAGEVVLCGIDLGSYEDPDSGAGLDLLTKAVLGEAESMWVRLSSIDVTDVGEGLVRLLESEPMLCPHLHLPLQSGDTGVLARMGRAYTPEVYVETVTGLRERIPDLSVTTDVMVGFPGEDERAFSRTCRVVEQLQFSRVHVFKYSRRPGTEAFKLEDTVSPQKKNERSVTMRALAGSNADRFNRGLVGRIIPVLIEATMTGEPGSLFGRAMNFSGIIVKGSDSMVGRKVDVVVKSAVRGGLRGEIVTAGAVRDNKKGR